MKLSCLFGHKYVKSKNGDYECEVCGKIASLFVIRSSKLTFFLILLTLFSSITACFYSEVGDLSCIFLIMTFFSVVNDGGL